MKIVPANIWYFGFSPWKKYWF